MWLLVRVLTLAWATTILIVAAVSPDLAIEGMSAEPAAPGLGQPVTVQVTLRNRGTSDVSTPFRSGLYVDTAPSLCDSACGQGWDGTRTVSLFTGLTTTLTFTHPGFDQAGPHTFYVQADAYCIVRADVERGNNLAGPLTVTVGGPSPGGSASLSIPPGEPAARLWPPSAPLGAWLGRVLLVPWERRDAVYYIWIVTRGYRADDGTAQFHPLLAWLALPLAALVGHPTVGLLLVSSLAGLALLLAFERLALLDLEPESARVSSLLLVFSPLAFILFAAYAEALFLLWAVLCLLWARRGRWALAGLAGALATLTRQQGLFLALPLAWELWEAAGRDWRRAAAAWRNWLGLGLIPAGLLVWLVYRGLVLGDLGANLSSLHALSYSLLISPSANQVVPIQTFTWPWHGLWLALAKMARAPEYSLGVDLVLGGGFLAMLALAWRRMRTSYRLYALVITAVSFGYHTGPHFPYLGLPRHLLLAYPVLIGLAPRLSRPWQRLLMVAGGLLGMLFLLFQYVIHGWVP
ncbi:MAG: hypothetical protein JW850_08425 [Thermoflexales bacterium]|nr:hypothetical protein [Thermoflexales bacterium]